MDSITHILFILFLVALSVHTFPAAYESHHYTNDFTIEIDAEKSEADIVARSVANAHGFRVLDQLHLPSFGHVYTLRHDTMSVRSKRRAEDFIDLLNSHPMVKNAEQEKILIREKREIVHDKQSELDSEYYEDKSVFQRFEQTGLKKDGIPSESNPMKFKDPYYKDQWYLENNGQAGGKPGLDVNVVPAWKKGFTGEGVVVTTLDDGIDHKHPDLKRNYDPAASTDLNDRDDEKHDPEPDSRNLENNSHGTKCAGEIAAEADNDVCGVGIAYKAKIGGIRILDGRVTDSLEAKALLFNNHYIQIFSASWGPRDNGATLEAPHKYCSAALKEGAEKGRNGLGSIFMWATGNGGLVGDCCNADGYVGSIYTLAIGSINNYAQSTYFTESCPSQLAVIYTGGYHDYGDVKLGRETHPILKVVTTDVGGRCTLNFQGTSSAAPLAAGCMALTLQANPNITWRDAQHIIVNTAKVPNKDEPGWIINGANKHVNPKFGFGAMDCGKMVEVAQTWKNVPPQHKCVGKMVKVDKDLDSAGTVSSQYTTDGCQRDSDHRIDHLEHVQLWLRMKHSRRGSLQITLLSPAGTPSEMLSLRPKDSFDGEFKFTFMSVHKWGENPRGTWKLQVHDRPFKGEPDNNGHVYEWQLILYGYSDSRDPEEVKEKGHATKPAQKAGEHTLATIMQKEQQKSEEVQIKKAPAVNKGGTSQETVAEKHGKGGSSSNGEEGDGDGDSMSSVISELLDGDDDDGDYDDDDITNLFRQVKELISSKKVTGLSHLSDDDIRDVLKEFVRKDVSSKSAAKAESQGSTQGQRSFYDKPGQSSVVSGEGQWTLDGKDKMRLESKRQKYIEDKKELDTKNSNEWEDLKQREFNDQSKSEGNSLSDVEILEKIVELLEK